MMRQLNDPENRLFSWFRRIEKPARLAFAAALASGLVVHLYMLTGKYPNHDDIVCLFANDATVTSGRWLLYVIDRLGSGFSLPWLNGFLSLMLLSATASLTVSLLRMERPSAVVLWSAALVAFPSVGNLFAFMFTSDGYCLGFFLAALAAWLTDRKKWGFLPGAPLVTLALACYQAAAAFFIAMLAVRGLQRLLSGRDTNRDIGLTILRYVLSLGLGGVLYLLSNRFALSLTHQVMEAYTGLDAMGSVSLSQLPGAILSAYGGFFKFALLASGQYTGVWLSAAHLLLGLSIGLMVALILIRRGAPTPLQRALAVAVTLLIPLLLNPMPLLGAPRVHVIMLYSFVFLYALALILYQRLAELPAKTEGGKRALTVTLSWITSLTVALCAFSWYIYTNQGYLELQLKYENTYALCLRMTDRVETCPGYEPGMPVVCIGEPGETNYPPAKDGYFGSLGSAEGFGSPSEFAFVYDDRHFHDFVSNYIGAGFPQAEESALAQLSGDPLVLASPCYPLEGSVFVLDGVVVIHAGEVRS